MSMFLTEAPTILASTQSPDTSSGVKYEDGHVFPNGFLVTVEDKDGRRSGGWTVTGHTEDPDGKGPGFRSYHVVLYLPKDIGGGKEIIVPYEEKKVVWQNNLMLNNFPDVPSPEQCNTFDELLKYLRALDGGGGGYVQGSLDMNGKGVIHTAKEMSKRVLDIQETRMTPNDLKKEIQRLPRTAGIRDAISRCIENKAF